MGESTGRHRAVTGDFEAARLAGLLRIREQRQAPAGIGTLGEKSLHAILKQWIDPDESHHEIRLDGVVADIYDGERVVEIQTGGFSALRPKLERLLPQVPVTVVYPLPWHKTLVWVNPETGESSKPRRSPKVGQFWDAAGQLIRIRALLGHPNLTVELLLLDMEEVRLADGWSADGKKGSHRLERFPTALGPTAVLREPADYATLLPPGLPGCGGFTAAELGKAARLSPKQASALLNILKNTGIIIQTGKHGRAYVYERAGTAGD